MLPRKIQHPGLLYTRDAVEPEPRLTHVSVRVGAGGGKAAVMNTDIERYHRGQRHRERKYANTPSMQPSAVGVTLSARIFPDVHRGDGEPNYERTQRLAR